MLPALAAAANENWIRTSVSKPLTVSPLLSVAETREEERGGPEEERVGGPGAREDSEQIEILQRGQALLLSLLHLLP